MAQLLKEKKSISDIIVKLTKEIHDCIIDDMQNVEELFSTHERCLFKTNIFKLSFQDEFPFLNDVVLHYTIYLPYDIDQYYSLKEYGRVEQNSSYDSKTNQLNITTCFFDGNPTSDFSESIIHEITHMYQYNKGMNKRVDLYDKVVEMYNDIQNISRQRVALALYYTFPHEQDAFTHQFYKKGGNQSVETFFPYLTLKHEFLKLKQEYKNNKDIQSAIHELGFKCKDYFKRLHFSLKRFERKLQNVKDHYFMLEIKESSKPAQDSILREAHLHMVWKNGGYNHYAPSTIEKNFDCFLNEQNFKPSLMFQIINKNSTSSCFSVSPKHAIDIILSSMPYKMKSFDATDLNKKIVNFAKQNNIGYWLFAEYFMKQRDPMEVANSLNYLVGDNVMASWEIYTTPEDNGKVFWIVDVQSKQKGGLTTIINYAIDYCKQHNILHIGLQAYTKDVESMYINKFGFKKIDEYNLLLTISNID